MSNINNLDCAKSYFKEFIEFSQIEVSQDFLKYLSQINRLPNYCPLGEEFSFIDLCLSWHSSPFGYNYIYWWKLQTLFIVFLIYKNTIERITKQEFWFFCNDSLITKPKISKLNSILMFRYLIDIFLCSVQQSVC